MSIKFNNMRDFVNDLERRMKKLPEVTDKAARRAAQRGRGLLVGKTPVDTGQMKNAWRVVGTDIVNDAPHAGIIEEGARPHKVSREGFNAIVEWAQRQLGADEDQARAVAMSVAKRLAKEGQKGHWIVRDSMDELEEYLTEALVKELELQADRKA